MSTKVSKNIRKLILEEVLKQTDVELITEIEPVTIGLGITAAVAAGVAAYNLYDQFSEASPNEKVDRLLTSNPNVNIVSTLKAKGFDARASNVKQHKQAFIIERVSAFEGAFGSWYNPGTNEDSIKKIIVKCGSQYGLAEVALAWPSLQNESLEIGRLLREYVTEAAEEVDAEEKSAPGEANVERSGDDLLGELNDELGASDFLEFVIRPALSLPFAFKDGKPIDEEQFLELLEASGGGGEDSGDRPELGWGLSKPYVDNIVKTMNAYMKTRGVNHTIPDTSKWNVGVQTGWVEHFCPHVFGPKGPTYLSEYKITAYESWANMSLKLKSDYPGYSGGAKGCLAFCLDAYYGTPRFGKSSAGPAVASSRSRSGAETETAAETAPSGIISGHNDLSAIQVDITQGLKGGRTASVDSIFGEGSEKQIARRITGAFKNKAIALGINATRINFSLNVKPNGKIKGGSVKVGESHGIQGGLFSGKTGIRRAIIDWFKAQDGKKLKGRAAEKKVQGFVDIPAGKYDIRRK